MGTSSIEVLQVVVVQQEMITWESEGLNCGSEPNLILPLYLKIFRSSANATTHVIITPKITRTSDLILLELKTSTA
jgi:hypothetical protein